MVELVKLALDARKPEAAAIAAQELDGLFEFDRGGRNRSHVRGGQLALSGRTKAPLRDGMTPARAADLLDFLIGPESYAELVLRAGWSPQRWTTWVAHTLTEQLFPRPDHN